MERVMNVIEDADIRLIINHCILIELVEISKGGTSNFSTIFV